jgi:hypothetical protein
VGHPWTAEHAAAALAAGYVSYADALCRRLVFVGQASPAVYRVMAACAQHRRRPDVAADALRRAVEVSPEDHDLCAALAAADDAAISIRTPAPDPARFLVILPWRQGFWSEVDHALGQLLLAEITGRTPVIYWGPGCLYRPRGLRAEQSAWDLFFEPVSGGKPERILPGMRFPGTGVFPRRFVGIGIQQTCDPMQTAPDEPRGALEYLGRDEPIVVADHYTGIAQLLAWVPRDHRLRGVGLIDAYRDLAARYLRPVSQVRNRVEKFAAQHLGPRPVFALHLRTTDKLTEDPALGEALHESLDLTARRLATDPDSRLFVLTDSPKPLEDLRRLLGGRAIATEAVRHHGPGGLHFMGHPDPSRLGLEVMVDTYLAARCDAFVGQHTSNIGWFVQALRIWEPGACTLVGLPRHAIPAPEFFPPPEPLRPIKE